MNSRRKKQGYFTWALVEGLKGGAANEQGEITLAGLVKYLQDAVPKRVRLDLGGDKNQKPFAVVEGYKADDLVISVVVKGLTARGNIAKTSDTVDSTAIELSFWDTIKNSSNPEEFKAYLQQYPDGRFAALAKIRANSGPSSITAPRVPSKSALQKVVAKDFVFELSSCRMSGGSVTCQFTVTNDYREDRQLSLYGGCYGSASSRVFDESGNEYLATDAQLGTQTGCGASLALVPQVITKAIIKFDKVDPEAITLRLLRLSCFWSDVGNFNADFRNVPIAK